MRSAPAAITSRTSSPKREKSAERMLGAMRNLGADMGASMPCARPAILRYHRGMPAVSKKYSVAVTAHSTYLPDQSDEEEDRYVFAYTIRITNNGSVTAQVMSRHWIITDADNQVQEVRGMGVVGEQPVLKPG